MRLTTPAVTFFGLASTISAFATPSLETLGLGLVQARDDVDPCTLANSPSVNASIQLASWMQCQVNGFFPYPANGAWDTVFAKTFDKSVRASFNDTKYDYDGWLKLYHSVNVTIGKSFAPFKHGFLGTVAVPNANGDKGGFVYILGWEGGTHALLKRDLYFTDASFVVVKDVGNGTRRVVEFRESSNLPNSAPLPALKNWTCEFPYGHSANSAGLKW